MPQEQMENLRDLLVMKLQVLYDIEQKLTQALPKMAEAADNDSLKMAFQNHLKETEGHLQRLNQAFEKLGETAQAMEQQTIQAMITDAQTTMDQLMESDVLDAALIGAGQAVEHYEMAEYGTAATWADQIGETEVKNLLGQTLDEEKAADEKLSSLAVAEVNQEATDAREELGSQGIFGKLREAL